MILGATLGEVCQIGAGILTYGLAAFKCCKISLPHAESIFTVLGENVKRHPYWSMVTRSQGLNEDDYIESRMLPFGRPLIIQLRSLRITERLGRSLQLERSERVTRFINIALVSPSSHSENFQEHFEHAVLLIAWFQHKISLKNKQYMM